MLLKSQKTKEISRRKVINDYGEKINAKNVNENKTRTIIVLVER